MSTAALPTLLLGVSAWAIAVSRVYVLAWAAPVEPAALSRALARLWVRGEKARAIAVCAQLKGAWAAECAQRLLSAGERDAGGVDFCVDELRASYRLRAQWGVGALTTLARMAFPLALGSAIVVLSAAFAASDVAAAEDALAAALQCLTLGLAASVFCRTGRALVQRQGAARIREVAAVCRELRPALVSEMEARGR